MGKTHVYWIVRYAECQEKTRIKGDPECASQEEIDKYLADKYIHFRQIDEKANYAIQDDEEGERIYTLESY